MFRSKSRLVLALALALAGAAPVAAQIGGDAWFDKWQEMQATKANPAPVTIHVPARVVKVDNPGQALTISHGAVKKVGMPAMSMTLSAGGNVHLKMLKKGDRVTVDVEKQGGVPVVTGFKMRH